MIMIGIFIFKIHIVIPSMYGKNIYLSTTDIVSSNLDQGEVYNNM